MREMNRSIDNLTRQRILEQENPDVRVDTVLGVIGRGLTESGVDTQPINFGELGFANITLRKGSFSMAMERRAVTEEYDFFLLVGGLNEQKTIFRTKADDQDGVFTADLTGIRKNADGAYPWMHIVALKRK